MILNVYQTITIHSLRVDGISNSSILQIGAAGTIKGVSNNFNTGGFKGPAPEAVPPGAPAASGLGTPLVPLPSIQ